MRSRTLKRELPFAPRSIAILAQQFFQSRIGTTNADDILFSSFLVEHADVPTDLLVIRFAQ